MSKTQLKHTVVLSCLATNLNVLQIETMKDYLLPFVEQSNVHIILDFGGVRFMDCRMAGFLVWLNQILETRHSVLTLSHLTSHVKLLVDVLKLSSVIDVD